MGLYINGQLSVASASTPITTATETDLTGMLAGDGSNIVAGDAGDVPYNDEYGNLGDAENVRDALDAAGSGLGFVGMVYDTNGAAYKDVWIGTQAAYDLLTPDANTLYLIEEEA